MIEIKSRLKGAADKEKWVAQGASIVAKLKATKVVWFPPKPVEAGRGAATSAGKATTSATGKTTSATGKTTSAASKTTGAAKRAAKPKKT